VEGLAAAWRRCERAEDDEEPVEREGERPARNMTRMRAKLRLPQMQLGRGEGEAECGAA